MSAGDRYAGENSSGGRVILWACRQLLLWGGLTVAVYCAVGYRSLLFPSRDPMPVAPASQASATAAPSRQVPVNTLVYRANRQGHVFLDADVNGSLVRFVLDTGASFVALTLQDAAAAGISRHQLNFNARASTANGTTRVAPVRLREVRLGQLSIPDVDAAVVENLETSLLGQSFLKRLQSYEMRDGVLTISW